MSFCSNCGSSMDPNSKFCTACGAANNTAIPPVPNTIKRVDAGYSGERVQEFRGTIAKCPSCGEVLKALAAKCPACGLELREVENTASVKDFTEKLAGTISTNQKIDIIMNYPIPNAKADIFDFLVLATSNFDTKKYLHSSGSERRKYEAWLGKIEQAYFKAETLFKDDKDFSRFEELYNSDIQELRKSETNKAGNKHYFYGTIMMLMAGFVFSLVMIKGSGIIANPRLLVSSLAFFANGIVSYVYARKPDLRNFTFISYCANAVLNIAFCFVAPGHLFHILIIVACGLGTFINKKK